MKYEFHVGDYVETIGGFVGWICRTRDDGYIWVANKNVASCVYRMPEDLEYFNRIGKYDFTKPEQPEEIKRLVKSWIIDDGDDKGEYCFDAREVINKINELVDVMNKLKETKND